MLQTLISSGYDVNLRAGCGSLRMLSRVVASSFRAWLWRPTHPGICDEIVSNLPGLSALGLASILGHSQAVQVLLEARADVGSVNFQRRAALTLASMEGHEAVVRLLLSAGSPLNLMDAWGFTALGWAQARGHERTASLLRRAGGELSIMSGCCGALAPQADWIDQAEQPALQPVGKEAAEACGNASRPEPGQAASARSAPDSDTVILTAAGGAPQRGADSDDGTAVPAVDTI
mmetsp:Transcript_19539/g.56749  ORF Transcript_19539/g.56749 Transcript_19539/m.56749 type:complete len:233 (+) Transcript_19539:2-700(+)